MFFICKNNMRYNLDNPGEYSEVITRNGIIFIWKIPKVLHKSLRTRIMALGKGKKLRKQTEELLNELLYLWNDIFILESLPQDQIWLLLTIIADKIWTE